MNFDVSVNGGQTQQRRGLTEPDEQNNVKVLGELTMEIVELESTLAEEKLRVGRERIYHRYLKMRALRHFRRVVRHQKQVSRFRNYMRNRRRADLLFIGFVALKRNTISELKVKHFCLRDALKRQYRAL